MPGIVGFITQSRRIDARTCLSQMVSCLEHETFYNAGSSSEAQLGVYAGWVCHAGSYADCQPIWNETRDIALLFSGEHFASSSQNEALRRAGHQFDSENATS